VRETEAPIREEEEDSDTPSTHRRTKTISHPDLIFEMGVLKKETDRRSQEAERSRLGSNKPRILGLNGAGATRQTLVKLASEKKKVRPAVFSKTRPRKERKRGKIVKMGMSGRRCIWENGERRSLNARSERRE